MENGRSALGVLRDKLDFLQARRASTSGAAEQFDLDTQIVEVSRQIAEFDAAPWNSTGSPGNGPALASSHARSYAFVAMPLAVVATILALNHAWQRPLANCVGAAACVALLLGLARLRRPRWWGHSRVLYWTLPASAVVLVAALAGDAPAALARLAPPPFASAMSPFAWQVALGGLVTAAAILVNFCSRYRSPLASPDIVASGGQRRAFPVKDYAQLRDEFCEYMRTELDRYDRDVQWSDRYFTTLEAEVEVDRGGARRPRVAKDLVAAIRTDRKTPVFMLLGDPGSGKSVSLRRLCRQLYDRVGETGVVPVYVNLREWTGAAPTSSDEIARFIFKSLKDTSGRVGDVFLQYYFERMLDHGLFFFLIDSFDEMAPVLDLDEKSPQLKAIATAFDRFFQATPRCRSVISSRVFRQPRGLTARRISIRPFSESQIRAAMKTWMRGTPLDPQEVLLNLFSKRPDLVPAVRNPFTADLITHYIITHKGKLPDSYYDIFDSYFQERLGEEPGELAEAGFTPDGLLDMAAKIATSMYEAQAVGLEASVGQLESLVGEPELVAKAVLQLRRTRIARLGGGKVQNFSFVHRRFAEFFSVRAMLDKTEISLEAIPSDSRWRDSLVVYCGVAPTDQAERIAQFCWDIIRRHQGALDAGQLEDALPVVHCLRFLRDAFISRIDCVRPFQKELSALILRCIEGPDDVAAKIAAESLALTDPATMTRALQSAFDRNVPWIVDTALRATRHLSSIGDEAKRSIRRYVRTLPTPDLISQAKELRFSFSISEELRPQRRLLTLDLVSLGTLWLVAFLAIPIFVFARTGLFIFSSAIVLEVILASLLVNAQSRNSRWAEMTRRKLSPLAYTRPGFDSSVRYALLMVLPLIESHTSRGSAPLFAFILAAIMPWELALNLHLFKSLLSRAAAIRILSMAGLASVVAPVIFFLNWCLEQHGLIGTIAKAIAYIFFGCMLLIMTVAIGLFIAQWLWVRTIGTALDRRTLGRLEMESIRSFDDVYAVVRRLRSDSMRRQFIGAVRMRNIRLTGSVGRPPHELRASFRVRDEFARLREISFGLNE